MGDDRGVMRRTMMEGGGAQGAAADRGVIRRAMMGVGWGWER